MGLVGLQAESSLKCDRGFHHHSVEFSTIKYIGSRIILIDLVDIFCLQHDIPGKEPSGGSHFPVDRYVLCKALNRCRDRIVACADPEILTMGREPVDQI